MPGEAGGKRDGSWSPQPAAKTSDAKAGTSPQEKGQNGEKSTQTTVFFKKEILEDKVERKRGAPIAHINRPAANMKLGEGIEEKIRRNAHEWRNGFIGEKKEEEIE